MSSKQPQYTKTGSRPEFSAKRRFAYALTRGVFLPDSERFTVMDAERRVLGGVDEASVTFQRDPRVSRPDLFVGEEFGGLLDPARGADADYFARLAVLASLASDPDHARRALNINGSRE
jgi:hypothetical protein